MLVASGGFAEQTLDPVTVVALQASRLRAHDDREPPPPGWRRQMPAGERPLTDNRSLAHDGADIGRRRQAPESCGIQR